MGPPAQRRGRSPDNYIDNTEHREFKKTKKTIDDNEGDLHFLAHHVENGQWPWPSMLCGGQWVKSNLLEGTFAVNRPGHSIQLAAFIEVRFFKFNTLRPNCTCTHILVQFPSCLFSPFTTFT
ncbi:hypothetical protein TorRG33x02_170950 [Trema orientale]|uniref:Uncharacterized protein n=1 Tax=Trema orientale TaxID=63057 RepID=A0A2P5ENP0_TREOI|nr:hypothetical protein TorRG33x02_170950 [Trema orientale]